MAVPVAPNTTCDIFRAGVFPPGGSPAVVGVPGFLKGDWRAGQEAGDRNVTELTWTHILLIDAGVDIRDGYTGASSLAQQDTVYIPDHTGTQFKVIFIERVQQGTPHEHKRVYLDRQTPTWPTNAI